MVELQTRNLSRRTAGADHGSASLPTLQDHLRPLLLQLVPLGRWTTQPQSLVVEITHTVDGFGAGVSDHRCILPNDDHTASRTRLAGAAWQWAQAHRGPLLDIESARITVLFEAPTAHERARMAAHAPPAAT